MKKNSIIITLSVLLCAAIVVAYTYYKQYTDCSYKYYQQKIVSECTDLYKEPVKRTYSFNYLEESDINQNSKYVYPYHDKGTWERYKISRIMAARIAEAIWFSQFGENVIQCRPYSVIWHRGKWIVSTTRSYDSVGNMYIEISAKDGHIIRYILGK
jgi:hypothetical protein